MRKSRTRAAVAWLIVICLAGIAGCKRGRVLAPVEGKITLNNKPLADASVVLSPCAGNGPGPFVGTTNTEGRFALGPVGKPGGGAAAADYMVMITTVKQDPNSPDGVAAGSDAEGGGAGRLPRRHATHHCAGGRYERSKFRIEEPVVAHALPSAKSLCRGSTSCCGSRGEPSCNVELELSIREERSSC